jgi:hypothetical protein
MVRCGIRSYSRVHHIFLIGNACHMNPEEIMRRLETLRLEHRDLDAAIMALADSAARDDLQIARLKKRKLRLRDEIAVLEDALIPDIIA